MKSVLAARCRAARVCGPTCPSTSSPWRAWKALTACSVIGPKSPSAVTPSARCSTATAGPRSCRRMTISVPTVVPRPAAARAARVWGPTWPSTSNPWEPWNSFTACSVWRPNIPSAVTPSWRWSLTTSGPVSPTRRMRGSTRRAPAFADAWCSLPAAYAGAPMPAAVAAITSGTLIRRTWRRRRYDSRRRVERAREASHSSGDPRSLTEFCTATTLRPCCQVTVS